jgi:outer membrane cobalamin receptor
MAMKAMLLAWVLGLMAAGPAAARLSGTVVDASGAPVAEAAVRLDTGRGRIAEIVTAADGRFEFAVVFTGSARVLVSAAGLSPVEQVVTPDGPPLTITLRTAPFFEAVTVTSSRSDVPRIDSTVTTTVLASSDLEAQAAVTLDDALKLVPGFTLFRRTSSRVSNPTAQGITLRGLGGTGSSRSLVLADGVPLNDAFGGWVYWDKLPQAAVDRVEVLRGSGSDLYGADAVGGVVQILTRRPDRLSGRAVAEAGSLHTNRLSLFGGGRTRGWSYTLGGERFATDGYVTVAADQRGPIDTRAGSDHRSGVASAGYQAPNGWRVELAGNLFSEDRRNGTPAVTNATDSRRGAAEVSGGVAGGFLSARVYADSQDYDQTYSAVALDRASEDLNRLQHIPTRTVGVGTQWVRALGRHGLLAGVDARFIKGETRETRLAFGQVLGRSNDGGTQHVGSAFVQDTFLVSDRLTIVAGAHGDGWHTESNNTGYNKTLSSLSPRASFSYRLSDEWSIRGSGYGGFRAPTLNELYRGFRSGNTQTNPNESLAPERLHGADAGVQIVRPRVSLRATVFWNVLDDVISNVTLSRTPTLITLQRQNADQLRSAGAEFEADLRILPSLRLAFSSAIVDARFKGETPVRDNRVPQVPEYNAGFDLRYRRGGWTGSGQFRITGMQFEDDLNSLVLRRGTGLDVLGSRALAHGVSPFVAVENLLDSTVDVGRTPILTVGLPRTVRAGVHVSWR